MLTSMPAMIPDVVIMAVVEEPCASFIIAAISHASSMNEKPDPSVRFAIASPMPDWRIMPPNAPPAAVMRIMVPAIPSGLSSCFQRVSLSRFFCLASRAMAIRAPMNIEMCLYPRISIVV